MSVCKDLSLNYLHSITIQVLRCGGACPSLRISSLTLSMLMTYRLSLRFQCPDIQRNFPASHPWSRLQKRRRMGDQLELLRRRKPRKGRSKTLTERILWMSSVEGKRKIYLRWCVSISCTIEATRSSLETLLAIFPRLLVRARASRNFSSSTRMIPLRTRSARTKARTRPFV